MEFRKKKYHSVLNFHQLESAIDKKILNIRLVDELRAAMCDLSGKEKYLHLYWYNLKYYVHSLHAAYWLLHKILYRGGGAKTEMQPKHSWNIFVFFLWKFKLSEGTDWHTTTTLYQDLFIGISTELIKCSCKKLERF